MKRRETQPGGRCAHRQSGMVLVLSLLMLAALLLLAMVSATDSRLQTRMADNTGHAQATTAEADSALAWAEAWLMSRDGSSRPLPCTHPCSPGNVVYAANTLPDHPPFPDDPWWQQHAFEDGVDPVTGQRHIQRGADPERSGRYLIEEQQFVEADPEDPDSRNTGYYRIIARGGDARAPSVTMSYIARPWGEAAWRDAWPEDPSAAPFCNDQPLASPCGRLGWRKAR